MSRPVSSAAVAYLVVAAGKPGEQSSLFKHAARLNSKLVRAGRGGSDAFGQPAAENAVALFGEPHNYQAVNSPPTSAPVVFVVSDAVLTMDDASLA